MTQVFHSPLPVNLPPNEATSAILSLTLAHMRTMPSSLMVWSGPPGRGKTTASEQFRDALVALRPADSTPVWMMNWGGALNGKGTRQMHRGLTTVYKRFVEDESLRYLARSTEQTLAEDIVTAFRDNGTVLLVIDEAGTMSADEMRGVGMVIDEAAKKHLRMHILMISMDNITDKMKTHRVIDSRTTLDLDFGAWQPVDVIQLMHSCGTALSTAISSSGTAAEALGSTVAEQSAGDLRLVTTVGIRMNAVLAKPASAGKTIDLCRLASTIFMSHRSARVARASRDEARPTRRRRSA